MIYPMHHYPTHLIDAVHLPDGSRVIVRPALPQDIDAADAFYRALAADKLMTGESAG